MTDVIEILFGKKIFLVRFQYKYEKDITSNQPTVVIIDKVLVTKEAEVTRISEKNDKTVP